MQPNTISLVVDEANSGSGQVTHDFSRYEQIGNKSTYIGALHSFASRDKIDMFRTFPTRSGNYKGTQKSAVKFTKDLVVPGVDGVNITSPIIMEVSFSVPVGVSRASLVAFRQRVVSLLDVDSIMDDLNLKLMV